MSEATERKASLSNRDLKAVTLRAIYRDGKGQWHVENNKSLNGVWLRITEAMPLGGVCQFRVGEQRFLFRGSK